MSIQPLLLGLNDMKWIAVVFWVEISKVPSQGITALNIRKRKPNTDSAVHICDVA